MSWIMEGLIESGEVYGGSPTLKNMNNPHVPTTNNQKDNIITQLIPNKISAECSIIAPSTDICLSEELINDLSKKLGTDGDPAATLKAAKEKTGCDSQVCVIKSNLLTRQMRDKEIANVKVDGPTNVDWLSNIHIDNTLDMWTRRFKDFYHCKFSMADFADEKDMLANSDLAKIYKDGFRTFGCVINTDKYSGTGRHWMALFVDMRSEPFSVEFFNSSGNQPQVTYIQWLVDTANSLKGIAATNIIKVCRIRHQNSKTECGVYSLFYIWARLNNTAPEYFMTTVIDDKLMMEFRLHLFNDKRRPIFNKFNYVEQFGSFAQWEPDAGK